MKSARKIALFLLAAVTLLAACEKKQTEPPPVVSPHEWAWMSGSNTVNQAGTYGTKGTAAATNVPGAREDAVSWADSSDNLWLFGGFAYDSIGYMGLLNDLWKFDPAARQWTWVSGHNVRGQAGTYGTKGTPAPANVPGARQGAVSWRDSSGLFWLFGGLGYDEAGHLGSLNDLWRFDPATLEWTWISGDFTRDQAGVYGTKGTPAPANVPGARQGAASWLDASGNLWLIAGYGYDSAGDKGWLNDVWKFDSATLEWTWVSGSDVKGQAGAYGTKGTADVLNIPGGRYKPVLWFDSNGILWLLGGDGLDKDGHRGDLNDFWKFDPVTLEWTWVSGSDIRNAAGTYGTLYAADPANAPGGRYAALTWFDSSGGRWLFGGCGLDSAGAGGWLNDMWKNSLSNPIWSWTSGANTGGAIGVYGTLGEDGSDNMPGARYFSVSWLDSHGKLWLFGGYGTDSAGAGGWLNDLWRFTE